MHLAAVHLQAVDDRAEVGLTEGYLDIRVAGNTTACPGAWNG
jgi:hypothetical protein